MRTYVGALEFIYKVRYGSACSEPMLGRQIKEDPYVEKEEHSSIAGGIAILEISLAVPPKIRHSTT
jgi:hypothetical protein